MMIVECDPPAVKIGNVHTPAGVGRSPEELKLKIEELQRSVSEVYRYELLTTNQYLKQMELVVDIFNELADTVKRGQGSPETDHQ